MSRIEEALRRARSSAVDAVPPVPPMHAIVPEGPPEPPPIVEVVAPPVVVPARVLDVSDEPSDLPMTVDFADPPDAPVEARFADIALEPASPPPQAEVPPLEYRLPRAEPARGFADLGVARPSRNEKLILNADLAPSVVEQYRKVAASLHQMQIERNVKIVMIASPMAEDGKTITASNIALTLSESFRRRVLLIDADLRRPSIHTVFGTPNVTGLNDALTSDRDEKLTIFEATPRLSILPSGRPNADPMSSLVSERMRAIITEAGAKFDWVIIDTPPVAVLADAKLLAEMVHAVVLVIGAGRTPFKAIERAIEAIDRKRIAGVVLNRVAEQSNGYHYYDYYAGARRE